MPDRNRWLTRLIGAGIILLLTCALFWPLFLHRKHLVPFHVLAGDPALKGIDLSSDRPDWRYFDESPVCKFYAEKTLVSKEIMSGNLPLWNPFNGIGTPLMANAQSQPAAPFFIPFLVNPSPWTYSWMLLIQLLFGATGMCLLLSRLDLDPIAIVTGVVLFTFNPYALNYLVYSDVWCYVWFPWIFWAAERIIKSGRGYLLLAGLIALMATSGHIEVAFFGAVAVSIYIVIRSRSFGTFYRNLRALPVVAALTIGLSAFWLIPFVEYVANSTSGRFGGNIPYPYHPSAMVIPGSEIFLAPPLVLLIALGTFSARKAKVLFPLLPGLLWAIAMMFPWPSFIQKISTLNLFSGRYGRSIFWFTCVLLASYGVRKLLNRDTSLKLKIASGIVVLLWWGLSLYLKAPTPLDAETHHWVPLQGHNMTPTGSISLMTILALMVLFLSKNLISLKVQGLCLSVLACFSVLMFHGAFSVMWNKSKPEPSVAVNSAMVAGGGRAWFPSRKYWKSMPPNLSCAFGIRDIRYNDPLRPEILKPLYAGTASYSDMFQNWNGNLMDFLGVTTAFPIDYRGSVSVKRTSPLTTRGFFLTDSRIENNQVRSIARAYLKERWRSTVFLEGSEDIVSDEKKPGPVNPTEMQFLEDSPNRVSISVSSSSRGWILLKDLYWPGWKATMDGKPVKIYRADGIFRAVPVDPGRHTVKFSYLPISFISGLMMTLLTLTAILIVSAFRFRWGNSR